VFYRIGKPILATMKIEIGRAHCLKHGTETAVLSNGPIGKNVTLALANLNNPTTIAHYDFAFVKPWTKKITFCF
jgi:1-deoxy-D-xylulose-5-phosphate synthase